MFSFFRSTPWGLAQRQRDNAHYKHLKHKAAAEHHAAMAAMYEKQAERLDKDLQNVRGEVGIIEPALDTPSPTVSPIRRSRAAK